VDVPPDEPTRPGPGRAWRGFAAGCRVAQWGAWVEFVGLALAAGVLVVLVVYGPAADAAFRALGGPWALVLLFLASAVGTGLVAVGRGRMLSLPDGTGATGPLVGAVLLTLARLVAAVATVVPLYLTALGWRDAPAAAAAQLNMAGLAVAVGLVAGGIADLSVVPALAVVGGAVPSADLRRKAGTATAGLQGVAVLSAAVGFWLTYKAGADRIAVAVAIGLMAWLQFAATLVLSSLYTAGAAVGRPDRDGQG
jgi:hypothetical protein